MQGIYFPIFLIIISGLLIGLSMIAANRLLAPVRPDFEKELPYECGFDALEDARSPFNTRYYLVAILFILFDLELIFLLPWAVALPEIGNAGFVAMLIFLALLGLGFVYEWRRNALEWD
ncbi:MAG: NADH-quinone oxidoreductase subunit A [Burkholderiales bacterium]|jgi:NADH-quinone oxidoreductase subunit A|nr:NADH-quinone oxidoreductase subunit A [Burkholderiales bacterium]